MTDETPIWEVIEQFKDKVKTQEAELKKRRDKIESLEAELDKTRKELDARAAKLDAHEKEIQSRLAVFLNSTLSADNSRKKTRNIAV